MNFSPHTDFYLLREKMLEFKAVPQAGAVKHLIGHCYLHGMMHGEGLKSYEEGGVSSSIFHFM